MNDGWRILEIGGKRGVSAVGAARVRERREVVVVMVEKCILMLMMVFLVVCWILLKLLEW